MNKDINSFICCYFILNYNSFFIYKCIIIYCTLIVKIQCKIIEGNKCINSYVSNVLLLL